jgi:hypothetical protein
MGNVDSECIDKLNTLVDSQSGEVLNQAKRGLYNYQSCCNHLQNVFKSVLLSYIVDRYNDTDDDGQVLETINSKQAECYCTWVSRNIPDDVSGGNARWRVEYEVTNDPVTTLSAQFSWQPITGVIQIQSSIGQWGIHAILNTNRILYEGNSLRSFDVSVSIAMSTQGTQNLEYSYEKKENGVPSFEYTPQVTATTPGGNVPHATVSFQTVWSPQLFDDYFVITVRDITLPIEALTLTTFNVVITEQ